MTPGAPCPICASPLPKLLEVYDQASGILISNGNVVYLSERENEFFAALWEANGRVVSRQNLMRTVYWMLENEEPHIKIADVLICKIRRKLKQTNIHIETLWRQGYQIRRRSVPNEQ
ncbi:MAG: helix-turn-helix domain-containing protein [Rhizobiaceae bacterium]|nr:helix-turn-helix domain-containing protein [Rhizobiaceae bacterium]